MSWDICETVAADGRFIRSPSGSQQGKRPGAYEEVQQLHSKPAPTLSVRHVKSAIPPQFLVQTLPRGDKSPLRLSPKEGKGRGKAPSASSCDAGGLPPECRTRLRRCRGMRMLWKGQGCSKAGKNQQSEQKPS